MCKREFCKTFVVAVVVCEMVLFLIGPLLGAGFFNINPLYLPPNMLSSMLLKRK